MNNTKNIISTCYGDVAKSVIKRAYLVRLLICDVDGVLSDGLIYQGNQGEELKAFHVRDGYGICSLLNTGIEVAIITGRTSRLVSDRANTLGIRYLYQGQTDKRTAFNELLQKLNLSAEQVAYIGDDLIDWPVMQQCGLAAAVADAHPFLLSKAHYTTYITGGHGAVRELCDLILFAQGKLEHAIGRSI